MAEPAKKEVNESEISTLTNLDEVKYINETQKSAQFNVTVQKVQKAPSQPSSGYVEMVSGKDLAIISLKVSIENTNVDRLALGVVHKQ